MPPQGSEFEAWRLPAIALTGLWSVSVPRLFVQQLQHWSVFPCRHLWHWSTSVRAATILSAPGKPSLRVPSTIAYLPRSLKKAALHLGRCSGKFAIMCVAHLSDGTFWNHAVASGSKLEVSCTKCVLQTQPDAGWVTPQTESGLSNQRSSAPLPSLVCFS